MYLIKGRVVPSVDHQTTTWKVKNLLNCKITSTLIFKFGINISGRKKIEHARICKDTHNVIIEQKPHKLNVSRTFIMQKLWKKLLKKSTKRVTFTFLLLNRTFRHISGKSQTCRQCLNKKVTLKIVANPWFPKKNHQKSLLLLSSEEFTKKAFKWNFLLYLTLY